MIKNIACFFILSIITAATAMAQPVAVERVLDEFNRAQSVGVANRYFALLNKEQFTEERIQFSSRVPADSVRQQVWYWTSEWYYDKQDYNKSKDYGLKALKLYHGGSEREADYDKLMSEIERRGIPMKDMWWYLDTRKFGTVPHSGFGLGFERLILFVTGMANIRDVIPFPRTPNNAEF